MARRLDGEFGEGTVVDALGDSSYLVGWASRSWRAGSTASSAKGLWSTRWATAPIWWGGRVGHGAPARRRVRRRDCGRRAGRQLLSGGVGESVMARRLDGEFGEGTVVDALGDS